MFNLVSSATAFPPAPIVICVVSISTSPLILVNPSTLKEDAVTAEDAEIVVPIKFPLTDVFPCTCKFSVILSLPVIETLPENCEPLPFWAPTINEPVIWTPPS